MSVEVQHDRAKHQYTIVVDGAPVGFAAYEVTGSEIAFTHTEVDPAQRGGGYAGTLVQEALDDVRATTSLRVVPACSYVAAWIGAHPDYDELTRR